MVCRFYSNLDEGGNALSGALFSVGTVVMCRLGWRHAHGSLAGNRSLKGTLLLLSLLMNLQMFFSMCISWGVNALVPFNVFWAISETAFIRSSEAVQNIVFLCQGEDQSTAPGGSDTGTSCS